MFEKSDKQLIDKAMQGHKGAWNQLVKRYESAVFNYGVRMTGNKDDALDLMQEVFISVFRNLANFRGEGSFRAWLFRIAHYRCIEFYRRKRPTQGLDEVPELEDLGLSPEFTLTTNRENQDLIRAMQSLPVNQRAVIELKFFGHFTFAEIATQLGVSTNTAKSRMYSALEKMKMSLEVDYA